MGKNKNSDPVKRSGIKPIPRTIEAWINELTGCMNFAIKKPHLIDASGVKWFDSMRTYYLERVAKLAATVPPGMNKAEAKRLLADVKSKLA